eukprot:TRINITY_DN49_c2_g1_i1.p1 TRINITY_DN49_c2_g1~~TRINITY_DN49_c2_g1_i1.p1  ORF type:complete len:881 (+),score=236.13 TRINITY_DN49_c2_g1_i1:62-2644(+)
MRSVAAACLLLPVAVSGAGEPDGSGAGSAPSGQTLRLNPGERLRSIVWGPGLLEETLDVDVLVAGGGSAGTSAAIAAARNGARTALVNGHPVLGGNSGSEIRLAMVGACGPRAGRGNENALKMECREGGIVEEYTLGNAYSNPNHVPELFSLELLNTVRAEPLIELYQNTWLVGVEKNGTRITAGICEDQMSQRRYRIRAKVFIDTTGDGRLGAEAGAEYIQGREGKDTYNESLAEGPDHETEGSSLAYMTRDYGTPQTFVPPPWAAKFNKTDFKYRGVSGTSTYGYWWNEVSWPYNTITDDRNVTRELLADLMGIWDYIKNSGDHPESRNYGLDWFGYLACKREGRRFIGQYVSSQNDIMKDPKAQGANAQAPELYWDRVAYSGWAFDLHNPKGMRDLTHPPYSHYETPYVFSTPLRSLTSKDNPNLMFAGRLASFSHVVFGSQRVMKTCATMGQAAGTAAAYAVKHGVDPAQLTQCRDCVWSVQQQLLRDDAFVIGMYNEDPRDLARNATISASTQQVGSPDGRAVNVISGQTRAIVAPRGVPEGQGKAGANRWISKGLPASLTLELQRPAAIKQAQLIFDTGMHRKLTFSVVSGTNMPYSPWGPQPETVRDYSIEGRDAATGEWLLLCNVTGNYQRRRVHSLPCPPPAPTPTPPTPEPAPVSAVVAATCDPSSSLQLWEVVNGSVRSSSGLCLSYSADVAAGGHGQAVTATPCNASDEKQRWVYESGHIKLPAAVPCSEYSGSCQCAHVVSPYKAGAGVELWACNDAGTHVRWSMLKEASAPAGVLMTGGLCMMAPKPAPPTPPTVAAARAPVRAAPAAASVSSVRITVTATNGIADAHVNEVRLYETDGIEPFPSK